MSQLARATAVCLTLLASGCSRNIQNKEAVREGVMKHLGKVSGLDMAKMSVDVASVSFRGNEADVTVTITPQGMDAASGMQMVYTMARNGSVWEVKGRRGATPGNPHGMTPGGATLPPGHPPAEAPRQ